MDWSHTNKRRVRGAEAGPEVSPPPTPAGSLALKEAELPLGPLVNVCTCSRGGRGPELGPAEQPCSAAGDRAIWDTSRTLVTVPRESGALRGPLLVTSYPALSPVVLLS